MHSTHKAAKLLFMLFMTRLGVAMDANDDDDVVIGADNCTA